MQKIQLELSEETKTLIQSISDEVKEIKKNLQPKEPPKYYTRKEVSKILNINLSTVHNWCKKGMLKPMGIGSRVYFLREDIEEAIIHL